MMRIKGSKAYVKPRLEDFGNMALLTQGSTEMGNDSMQTVGHANCNQTPGSINDGLPPCIVPS